MASTRFNGDAARIIKSNQQSTGPGRWVLDVPGNGETPVFALDPQIIPQKWGGNLWTNSIDVQSSLLGIDKGLNRDCIKNQDYKRLNVHSYPLKQNYPICDQFLTTEQSRAIMPAWTVKDLEQNNFNFLFNDPQKHTNIPFKNSVSTRILEKDNFKPSYQCNNDLYTIKQTHTKT